VSTLDVVQRLRAASDGQARPRASMCHRHLDEAPLVIVMYRMSGESAAPLGVMYGTGLGQPRLLVAPEPRNRQIRFQEVFNPLARDLNRYVASRAGDREIVRNRSICRQAPQLLVPNMATADFVGSLLGRSLRYLKTEGEYAVPEDTVIAGAHLTWLGMQSELPGSSVLLAATELLRRHWVTGVSDLESEDLHVQLAWLDPPVGSSGATAATAIEERRFTGELAAGGPTPDPSWDRDILDPLVAEFNARRDRAEDHITVERLGADIRHAVREGLEPTWRATWRAIDLLRALPKAPSITRRWEVDRREFTNHAERVEAGEARFRARDSVKQAAYMVSQREDAQSMLDASEALDDPLVMAGAIGDGQAIAGTVVAVTRPMVELSLAAPCPVPIGTELYWADQRGKCSAVLTGATDTPPFTVSLETKKGKTKYYPGVGARAVYGPFKEGTFPPPRMPANVPWTHVGAEAPMPSPEVPE
jgi:hypothetical protein